MSADDWSLLFDGSVLFSLEVLDSGHAILTSFEYDPIHSHSFIPSVLREEEYKQLQNKQK